MNEFVDIPDTELIWKYSKLMGKRSHQRSSADRMSISAIFIHFEVSGKSLTKSSGKNTPHTPCIPAAPTGIYKTQLVYGIKELDLHVPAWQSTATRTVYPASKCINSWCSIHCASYSSFGHKVQSRGKGLPLRHCDELLVVFKIVRSEFHCFRVLPKHLAVRREANPGRVNLVGRASAKWANLQIWFRRQTTEKLFENQETGVHYAYHLREKSSSDTIPASAVSSRTRTLDKQQTYEGQWLPSHYHNWVRWRSDHSFLQNTTREFPFTS